MADNAVLALEGDLFPPDREDDRLVVRFTRGDQTAFDALVAAHRDRVSRLAYRLLGWSADADDVVQEVFLAAWKALPRFEGRSSVATWLTRITINECRSFRRRWRRAIRKVSAEGEHASAPAADSRMMDSETFDRVRQAVAALPARYREVIVLHYLEQMPSRTVSELLGVSPGTVEVRLHRARAKLKDKLADLMQG